MNHKKSKHSKKSHKKSSKKYKKHKKEDKKHKKYNKNSSSSDTSSNSSRTTKSASDSETEWIEKPIATEKNNHEEWMGSDIFSSLPTFSNDPKIKKLKEDNDKYDPKTNIRELNPYWKDGGSGLPSASKMQFKKPVESNKQKFEDKSKQFYETKSSWKKSNQLEEKTGVKEVQKKDKNTESVNEKDVNAIAAKLIKAEMLGQTDLVEELKLKLEKAKSLKNTKEENVILTKTDSRGYSKPLEATASCSYESKKKKRKLETFLNGERIRFFDDDDKYSLKQLFEQEKYNNSNDQEKEFMKLSSKIDADDNLDPSFGKAKVDDNRERDHAIKEHKRISKMMDDCKYCIESNSNLFTIATGKNVYITIPQHESLTKYQCLIIPFKHISCSVQLDEDVWDEVQYFRKKLKTFFNKLNLVSIFFEMANNLNKYPHMAINCVGLAPDKASLAPMYFKKAIMECESEWSTNKKLIDLKNRNVYKAIPKGLPYFFVDFEMGNGYAHVIEDRRDFPLNFAQEIIGGLLDISHKVWRKPQKENEERLKKKYNEFKEAWNRIH